MQDVVFTPLVTPDNAAILDKEASSFWGLNPFSLVEAAGRACAVSLERELGGITGPILVCAGSGNNGADALVMLRAILTADNRGSSRKAAVLLSSCSGGETSPRAGAVKTLKAMGIPVITWNGEEQFTELFRNAALIIDGIAGTGLRGALKGAAHEMFIAVNKRRNTIQTMQPCTVVSIDIPSGAGIEWKPDFPVVNADYTLAVEPLKTVLYTPALRPMAGKIIPVRGIFPPHLLSQFCDAELLCWENQCRAVPTVPPDAYKYNRGLVEVHAGKTGFTGAARIAAEGASAAGAGLVRLILDDDLYSVLAAAFGGVMPVPFSMWSASAESIAGKDEPKGIRFKADALLLGPGWGRGEERLPILRRALEAEQSGIPLVLDADGIFLLKKLSEERGESLVFNGRTILCPHAGELEALSGIAKEKLLSEPALIADFAQKINAVILFKSHVMIIAEPGGKLGFIDGMDPSLGAGGSGDLLAGLCAGIAGRMKAAEGQVADGLDLFNVAAAAGTLLTAAAARLGRRFYDPLELAKPAAALAGFAWLPQAAWLPPGENDG